MLRRKEDVWSQADEGVYSIGPGESSFDGHEQEFEDQHQARPGYYLPPPDLPRAERAYAELLVGYRRQQQACARLSADLLAMTHRYLEAQVAADDACAREAQLRAVLEDREARELELLHALDENRRLRKWCEEQKQEKEFEKGLDQEQDRADTVTSSSTICSTEKVAVDLPFPSASVSQTEVSSEELVGLVRTTNIQSLEITRACIASATFRPGIRMLEVDNKMVVNVTEGIGCVLVQLLRSRNHSKDKSIVKLALQTLLSYHVFKLVESWQDDKAGQEDCKDKDSQSDQHENQIGGFDEAVEAVLDDIVTILSLSGSPGQTASLKRNHHNRVGSTVNALLKTAQQIAGHIKSDSCRTLSSPGYKILYARPGSPFNKNLMQRQGQPQGMARWKAAPKAPMQVLCTREIGLAHLLRSAALNRTASQGSGGYRPKGLEVLAKATVVFESEVDK
ncbi:hypothetical protein DFH11DRAFT_1561416 [Phellopilus nigrolimitatus]|nr:hypothetical protein DFH11DRAFT_1561416 [Phellopilus nigrolimitatus]